MLIDTTLLMYATFQSCRHGRTTGIYLDLLGEILKVVQRQGTVVVDIPDDWLDIVYEPTLRKMRVDLREKQRPEDRIASSGQPLFALLYVGIHELQRLWASESTYAVRSLGYAFHMIPQLLRTPEQFDRKAYRFCFRMVSAHWDELSPEMRQSFCDVLGMTLEPVMNFKTGSVLC